ncbi:hypothetical protein CA13_32080 [Planctomycetes bacterium CA13]|uniref:HEAT repeat protein n=1 Tax=Novipirellula herctigrandis TaxID=2527986 RepID=A0A5C5Z3H5_9BACT|nr:hypothetical protein CA13_32080 [Planctomycetes bacterium CA13]
MKPFVVVGCTVFAFASHSSAAQEQQQVDKIWLQSQRSASVQNSWYPQAIEVLEGEITEFDAKRITIRFAKDGKENSFSAARVLWIEPGNVSEKQAAAMAQFEQREFDKALLALLDSLKERPPIWRQQWLSMMAAQSAWRSGRSAIALELVGQLDRRPLPAMVLALLPVAWKSRQVPAETIKSALARLEDPSPAVRLVAASWLLSSGSRAEATQALKGLSRDNERPAIARLAEAVLWRTIPPPDVASLMTRLEERVDALPMVVQVGPTVSLIERLDSAGESEAAKRLQLSLEITPPHPHPDLP